MANCAARGLKDLAGLIGSLYQLFFSIAKATYPGSSSRIGYDPYISCWDRPATSRNGLPAGYLQSDYHNNLLLCSAAHGVPQKNVGCYCASPGTAVQCHRNIADSVLWDAVVTWRDHGFESYPFPEYCKLSCECLTEREAQAEYRGDINWYDANYERLINAELPFSASTSYSSNIKSDISGFATSSDSQGDDGSQSTNQASDSTPVGNAQNPPVAHDQCGNHCTSNKDCSTGRNHTCMCSTQSEKYQPESGTAAFVAACIISLSGKRAEDKPCSCNSTYVSHACCRAEDGLVWEEGEFKMGELLLHDEVSVL